MRCANQPPSCPAKGGLFWYKVQENPSCLAKKGAILI